MPPEIVALIHRPDLLIGVMAVGAFFGVIAEQLMAKLQRGAWLRKNSRQSHGKRDRRRILRGPWRRPRELRRQDAADQLRVVMGAEFTIQPLLNKSEVRVFKELDRYVTDLNPNWQVMAQVSLGEILHSKDAEAYRCINSKRVDLLIVDGACQPRHAIEYQGAGHHQGTAAARDAVKREALRRAGIGYQEVVAGQTTPAELRQLVGRLVDRPAAGS